MFKPCPFCGVKPTVQVREVVTPLFLRSGVTTKEVQETVVCCANDECATRPSLVCRTISGANLIWNGLLEREED